MTLIELMIGLAIASLMTITGWRAIETLQTARDQTVNDASRWQAIDTFFATLEADLRRAELSSFSGRDAEISFQLPGETVTAPSIQVRYWIAPAGASWIAPAGASRITPAGASRIAPAGSATTAPVFNLTREADTGALTFVQVRAATFAYRASANTPAGGGAAAGTTISTDATLSALDSYPRAVQITLATLDNNDPNEAINAPRTVKRLLVLR